MPDQSAGAQQSDCGISEIERPKRHTDVAFTQHERCPKHGGIEILVGHSLESNQRNSGGEILEAPVGIELLMILKIKELI
jgi:hypothetical protein